MHLGSKEVRGHVLPSSLKGGIPKANSKNGRLAYSCLADTMSPSTTNCYNSDTLSWRWCYTRVFSTRSAYAYLLDTEGLPTDGVRKRVWSLRVPQRIRTFLWITLHQRHLTNAEHFRRHLATSAMCSICYLDVEDLDHILRRCVHAQNLWIRLIPSECFDVFFRTPFEEDILARMHRFFEECSSAFVDTPNQNPSVMVPRAWSRTPSGWVRVNVDASVNIVDGKATIGCVFRNDQVHNGLAQAWTLGFRRVVIDTDFLEVVFRHVLRYQNAIVDRLAVAERSSSRCGLLLPFPPADLSTLVEEENKQNAGKPVLTQDWRVTANVVCFNLHSDLGG
ncbi:hypothetical protein V6N11_044735 [Hibiscus sabdariffa]|uniref:Reverse transcriptase zinc-binding domain-containing protein n=1 Tax=Hibiscus sabdariffa TaxID=183260 RepID=A0ABR2PTS0_9ROSI